jgi:hypothetical protein
MVMDVVRYVWWNNPIFVWENLQFAKLVFNIVLNASIVPHV